MSQALYRKYRSRSLDELVGQEHVTSVLKRALEKGQPSHAYLLTGPRGVGKTSIARILAHEINGISYDNDATDLDIIEIDAASNRRIDDIRDLREKVHIAPSKSKYKIYIIDEVHMLTGESFNALLKTLEEPPAHVIFILATTEIDKLPATITSRTQTFHFRRIPADIMTPHLRAIADKEKITIDDDALAVIASHSQGSLRDAESALDQIRHTSAGSITRADAEATLGSVAGVRIDELLGHVHGQDPSAVAATLKSFEAEGLSATIIARELSDRLLTSDPDFSSLGLLDALLDVPRSYAPSMKLFSTLMRAAIPREAAMAVVAPTAKKIVTAKVTIPSPDTQTAAPSSSVISTPAKDPNSSSEETPARVPSVVSAPFDWDSLIAHAKDNYIALHSVLSKCQHTFDGETLTVYSKFKLHKTKLEDAKYKAMLDAAIKNLTGSEPQVLIVFGAKPITDENLAGVAALMGGGEEVNVG